MKPDSSLSRRRFTRRLLRASAAWLAAPAWVQGAAPAPAVIASGRPLLPQGVASGDVTARAAVIWSRTDRPARMMVEWSPRESMADARRVAGGLADAASDFTAKTLLADLPPGQRVFYRVTFEAEDAKTRSEPAGGSLATAPADDRTVRFLWSGDTCGQGWGIDESRGGFLAYESMRRLEPDFFIHSGDNIYADNPLLPTVKLPDGTLWRNVVTPEKAEVAQDLAGFRGNYRYNLLDRNVRSFNASVATLAQWDDHEVRNNWYPGQVFTDDRYTVRAADQLFPHARRAFFDYLPIRPDEPGRIYRAIPRGPLCEVFLLDQRSYRGPNTGNRQAAVNPETAFLGAEQLRWLKAGLRASRAVWKIIASDMPLGMVIGDTKDTFEAWANGGGPPLGRELELADLLGFLRNEGIVNTVWLTADVHHAISHHFHPDRAVFKNFDPFWEFVSGPLHAGTFGPGKLDPTFGPEVKWNSRRPGDPGTGPYSPDQFFGQVEIQGQTKALTVTHFNRDGRKLAETVLEPARSV